MKGTHTWESPLGGLASWEAWVAVTGHSLPGGLLPLWTLAQLPDVMQEGGSIESALWEEVGVASGHAWASAPRPQGS